MDFVNTTESSPLVNATFILTTARLYIFLEPLNNACLGTRRPAHDPNGSHSQRSRISPQRRQHPIRKLNHLSRARNQRPSSAPNAHARLTLSISGRCSGSTMSIESMSNLPSRNQHALTPLGQEEEGNVLERSAIG